MLRLQDVLAGLGFSQADGVFAGPPFPHIAQDSREVQPGDLFVARRGETTDGHVYAASAVERGARAVLAERIVEIGKPVWVLDARSGAPVLAGVADAGAVAYILVGDSTQALERIAAWWRSRLAVQVMGITGSVGKTSTKEMVAAVLSSRFRVLRSERSLNTDVGMALTLLQLAPEHEKAVLEMGMYGLGEIAHLCHLAKPLYGIVTNVGPTHLERLGSIENIAEAKTELIEALPAAGVAILNGDDERVRAMAQRSKARVFTYGMSAQLDLWASDAESHGLQGIQFKLHAGNDTVSVRSPLLGMHSVHTALAAAAAGLVCGLTWDEIAAGLTQVPRQLRLVVVAAANGATLIDDSYNSSPVSCLAALNLLADVSGRQCAVLGDMLELGAYEETGHRLVGRRAADVTQMLVAVGPRGRVIGEEALAHGMASDSVYFASTNAEAADLVRRLTGAGDFVLIKGSRGMKMEEIVRSLQ
jgi:UDP-N-acetylmuramoyl-tripeptide--D-alanyl-D-alanine ligase